jgi:putative membrane protein
VEAVGYWDDDHMDGGWGVVMVLGMIGVWVGLVVLIVLAVLFLLRSGGVTTGRGGRPAPGAAEQILAERLARGEIDVEEYRARLAALAPPHQG